MPTIYRCMAHLYAEMLDAHKSAAVAGWSPMTVGFRRFTGLSFFHPT
jgi:hypothetical protein